uniref:Uncharacterized protein n=1 Tax=Anguilla anguilla TaxID=7936 RepID=A0A0E9QWW7_ANGAN
MVYNYRFALSLMKSELSER